jgi:hypothetical protein
VVFSQVGSAGEVGFKATGLRLPSGVLYCKLLSGEVVCVRRLNGSVIWLKCRGGAKLDKTEGSGIISLPFYGFKGKKDGGTC